MGPSNKYKFFENENFENKVIKEVDEDKEEESEFNSSNKKKTKNIISKHVFDELKINPIIYKDDENKIDNSNVDNPDEIDENKKIEIMKDMLINKFKGNKKFSHIKNDEFLFDNKLQIKASLSENNEIFIEIENNKYNLDSFLSKYGKDICAQNDLSKKEKGTFIYSKKIMSQNEHQKRRRKKRIFDDSEEET